MHFCSNKVPVIYSQYHLMFDFFTRFYFSVRATNTIWPPLYKASAENTTSLLPSLSDRPPLSWQHAMAQHLLGFSWMASDCISCVGIRSSLSHKHPALSENLQHTAVQRPIEVCICLLLTTLCVFWSVFFFFFCLQHKRYLKNILI